MRVDTKATILQLLLVVQTLLKKDGGVQVSDTTIAGKGWEAGNQDTLLLKSVHKKAGVRLLLPAFFCCNRITERQFLL